MFSRLQPSFRAIAVRLPLVGRQARCYAAAGPLGSTPISHPDTRDIRKQFASSFPPIANDLTKYVASHDSTHASHHVLKALEYNVPHGKHIRSLTYILSCKQLMEANNFLHPNLHVAYKIGWCIEMLQASILMVDDIIDGGEMRRDQLCWHKTENVGLLAVNDALLLENGVFYILKKYASQLPRYKEIVELFHETAMTTNIGQVLDMKLVSSGVSTFTMSLYQSLCSAKTSHFAAFFPIALASLTHGQHRRDELNEVEAICNDIGFFYQVEDDYNDCFGGVDVMKKGNDIAEGKCTWLAIKCLEIGSSADKAALKEFYGKNDSSSIERVRRIYEELELPALYWQYKNDASSKIREKILDIPSSTMKSILLNKFGIAFKR